MKGQADVLFLVVMFLAVAVSFVIIFFAYHSVMAALLPAITTNTSAKTVNAIATSVNTSFLTLGNLLVAVFFAIGIAAIVSALFVESSPIFFIISMFALGIEVLVSVLGHNIFFDITQSPTLLPTLQQVPMLITVFQYYPVICFVISLGIIIALYAKG